MMFTSKTWSFVVLLEKLVNQGSFYLAKKTPASNRQHALVFPAGSEVVSFTVQ